MSAAMDEPRQKELNELLSRDMVDIYVGPENTHWVLHEKLLCYRSRFFRNIFWARDGSTKQTMYGLPEDDDEPFKLFVAWLYSGSVPVPKEEKELSTLLDLYLMGEKWEIKKLKVDCLDSVRRWYHDTDTWPGLRRVQYIYSNTEVDSPMRQLMVSCVARMLVLGDGMPAHWDKALRRNGQLAVDVIMSVQKWNIDAESVPDARSEPVVPIYDESQVKKEIKEEEEDSSSTEIPEYQESGQQTEGEDTAVEDESQ